MMFTVMIRNNDGRFVSLSVCVVLFAQQHPHGPTPVLGSWGFARILSKRRQIFGAYFTHSINRARRGGSDQELLGKGGSRSSSFGFLGCAGRLSRLASPRLLRKAARMKNGCCCSFLLAYTMQQRKWGTNNTRNGQSQCMHEPRDTQVRGRKSREHQQKHLVLCFFRGKSPSTVTRRAYVRACRATFTAPCTVAVCTVAAELFPQ